MRKVKKKEIKRNKKKKKWKEKVLKSSPYVAQKKEQKEKKEKRDHPIWLNPFPKWAIGVPILGFPIYLLHMALTFLLCHGPLPSPTHLLPPSKCH